MAETIVAGTSRGNGPGGPDGTPAPHAETVLPGPNRPAGREPAGPPLPPQRRPGPSKPATLAAALRGRFWNSTPERLRLLRSAVLLLVVACAATVAVAGLGVAGTWDDITQRNAPRVTGAGDLYFALNDMDAQAANQLLSSGGPQVAAMPAQHEAAEKVYAAARHTVSTELLLLAGAAHGDPLAEATVVRFTDDFARYQELIGRALENDAHDRRKTDALTDYRAATDLLRQTLLPEAEHLGQTNDGAFEATYNARHATLGGQTAAVIALGLALTVVLVATQLYLARRFRRIINPGLLAATVCTVLATVLGATALATEAEDLRVARHDAFDSVVALSQARALSYDANADESRFLLDAQRHGSYEQAFQDASQRLLTLPGATLDTYDARLDEAWNAYGADHSDLRFTGYYGNEFRNITFPGERAAAEAAVQTYAVYERDDRTIRRLVQQGRLQDAVEFGIGWSQGASNYHFAQYDTALQKVIGINRAAFDDAAGDGRSLVTGSLWPAGGALLAAAVLTVLGLRPRLAEFR
ncbi:hypothetical protein ACIGXA_09305 [Streptomyces fildesensis]|uniref:Secreted protein n=1 Tax=Streptomyces fildesensis TaxID=375757 RepID=A0ABW8C4H0_9ACTN